MDQDERPDPLIDEIHEIRERIWREHGCDLDRYFDHLGHVEKEFEGEFISRTMTPEEEATFQRGLEKLRSMTPAEFEQWVAEDTEDPLSDTSTPVRERQDRSAA